MIEIWKSEMKNYNQPTKRDISEEDYLKQEIEVDAIAFAHYHMNKLFEVKTYIPDIIKDIVTKAIVSFD